jgi:hypothetical protein
MLAEMATVGDESIVSWQPHGKAFRVHMPGVFSRTVMRRYFNQTKYKSFQRQLHIYGFNRINKGVDRGAYFHSMFIRNEKSTSLRMCRQKIKGKKSVNQYSTCDPDFYCSSETNVVNSGQHQDRRMLANALLQSDPTILHAFTPITNETVFNNGSGSEHHHPDDEKPLTINSAFLFNQEVAGGPSPPHQLIDSEIGVVDWMEQAQTVLSRDKEEQASTFQPLKQGDDEGLFEGKRFFYVVDEMKVPPGPMVEDFSTVINRRGPTFYMPRSA